MNKMNLKRQAKRVRRAGRVRKKMNGTAQKPRLSVYRSNLHLQAQMIDDENGKTLIGLSTKSKEFQGTEYSKKSMQSATKLGQRIAELAKEKGINEAIFDRGHFKFHGHVKAIAEGARESGLKF